MAKGYIANVMCGKCGVVFFQEFVDLIVKDITKPSNTVLKCMNSQCENYGKEFEMPEVELREKK